MISIALGSSIIHQFILTKNHGWREFGIPLRLDTSRGWMLYHFWL